MRTTSASWLNRFTDSSRAATSSSPTPFDNSRYLTSDAEFTLIEAPAPGQVPFTTTERNPSGEGKVRVSRRNSGAVLFALVAADGTVWPPV